MSEEVKPPSLDLPPGEVPGPARQEYVFSGSQTPSQGYRISGKTAKTTLKTVKNTVFDPQNASWTGWPPSLRLPPDLQNT